MGQSCVSSRLGGIEEQWSALVTKHKDSGDLSQLRSSRPYTHPSPPLFFCPALSNHLQQNKQFLCGSGWQGQSASTFLTWPMCQFCECVTWPGNWLEPLACSNKKQALTIAPNASPHIGPHLLIYLRVHFWVIGTELTHCARFIKQHIDTAFFSYPRVLLINTNQSESIRHVIELHAQMFRVNTIVKTPRELPQFPGRST